MEIDNYYECLDIPTFFRRLNHDPCFGRITDNTLHDESLHIPAIFRKSLSTNPSEPEKNHHQDAADDYHHLFEVLSFRLEETGKAKVSSFRELYELGISDKTCQDLKRIARLMDSKSEAVIAVCLSFLSETLNDLNIDFPLRLELRQQVIESGLPERVIGHLRQEMASILSNSA